MKSVQVLVASLAAVLANPAPQAVTSAIAPSGSAPAGCQSTYNGPFEITVVKPSANQKRDLQKRDACAGTGTLVITLANGVLLDARQRTGYIASNYQFQFDGPPQAGALFTSGFSVCGNSSLALGPTTVFYECLSGGFYNLYNTNWAPQCSPVAINVIGCTASNSTAGASAQADGQPTVSSAATVATDGQIQASSAPTVTPAVTQATDGQLQATSAIVVAQKTDGQPNMPTALVSQLAAAPVSQISDGQVQAPNATFTSAPVTIHTAAAAALPTMVAEFAAVVAGAAAVVLL